MNGTLSSNISKIVLVLVPQSCLTLFNPMDYGPPGSSVHGILQARTLEWVAIVFSRGKIKCKPPTNSVIQLNLILFYFSFSVFLLFLFLLLLPFEVQFSHLVMTSSLQSHGLKHARFPVHHQLQELAQTHVHRVGDAIQPSHPLSSPSPPVFNLPQHQGLFQ